VLHWHGQQPTFHTNVAAAAAAASQRIYAGQLSSLLAGVWSALHDFLRIPESHGRNQQVVLEYLQDCTLAQCRLHLAFGLQQFCNVGQVLLYPLRRQILES
jgi:hypothetical protein